MLLGSCVHVVMRSIAIPHSWSDVPSGRVVGLVDLVRPPCSAARKTNLTRALPAADSTVSWRGVIRRKTILLRRHEVAEFAAPSFPGPGRRGRSEDPVVVRVPASLDEVGAFEVADEGGETAGAVQPRTSGRRRSGRALVRRRSPPHRGPPGCPWSAESGATGLQHDPSTVGVAPDRPAGVSCEELL
jgi:hypothetical protein